MDRDSVGKAAPAFSFVLRWIGRLGLPLVALIAACSSDVVSDPGYYLVHGDGHLQTDPTSYMAAAGCTPQVGPDSSGSIAVKLVHSRGISHFRCPGVSRRTLRRALAAYRKAARDSVGGASVQASGGGGGDGGDGDGGDAWVLIHYECDLNTQITYWDDGSYDVVQWVDNCRYYYQILSPGSPGYPGGGDDDSTSSFGPVASVTVTPSSATIAPGSSAQLAVTMYDAAGHVVSRGHTITWQSGNGAVASVGGQGLVTGVSVGGPVTITATSENSIAGTATITVVSSDSACQANADGTPTVLPGTGASPTLPAHGPLMSLALQDSIATLPNSSTTPENGAFIGYNTATHQYGFTRMPNTYSDVCSFGPVGGYVAGVNAGLLSDGVTVVVAYVHGHPVEGTTLSASACPSHPGQVALQVSDSDRTTADLLAPFTNTNYVVQAPHSGPMKIFTYGTAMDPATGAKTRSTDDQWIANGPNRCFGHIF
jgi:Big-like domain-containing protein